MPTQCLRNARFYVPNRTVPCRTTGDFGDRAHIRTLAQHVTSVNLNIGPHAGLALCPSACEVGRVSIAAPRLVQVMLAWIRAAATGCIAAAGKASYSVARLVVSLTTDGAIA